jgi:hypothetical protein
VEVGVLGLQPVQPAGLVGAGELGLGHLRQTCIEVGVPASGRTVLAGGPQPLQGVLADRLQHREARLAGLHRPPEQACLHQGGNAGHEVGDGWALGDRLGCLQGEPAVEDSQAPQQRPVGRVEQLVAPGDGVPEGPLPDGVVDRASDEHGDGGAEPAGQLLQREQPQAGGGQLDGQGQAVQPRHHLGDQRRVVGAQDNVGVDRQGPVGEQGHRVVAPGVGGKLVGPGQAERS